MKILVVGGAGYIGSHTVYELLRANHEVIVFDNLSTGNKAAIPEGVLFIKGDLCNKIDLDAVFTTHKIDAVMHFAAKLIVPESVSDPITYFTNNVYGVGVLLESMRIHGVNKFIFSSTAAVYGEPNGTKPIDELAITQPINPYGASKLAAEALIKSVQVAFGIEFIIFRYFNVAGADISGEIGLAPKGTPTHLIPAINETLLGLRPLFKVFGTDYNTSDGTCIRDYIHVSDLARAHVDGIEYLAKSMDSQIINLGTNHGFSVQEIMDAAQKLLQLKITSQYVEKRAGDPGFLVASNTKAKAILGWSPQYSVEDMIRTDYNWRQNPRFTNE
ncbi:MAG: UDP-glucose 4-epimerase GalE [Culicoidibacterales bacterium]